MEVTFVFFYSILDVDLRLWQLLSSQDLAERCHARQDKLSILNQDRKIKLTKLSILLFFLYFCDVLN